MQRLSCVNNYAQRSVQNALGLSEETKGTVLANSSLAPVGWRKKGLAPPLPTHPLHPEFQVQMEGQ